MSDNQSKYINVAIISSIASSTCLLGVVVGGVGLKLGLTIKNFKKKCFQHNCNYETNIPVYEDISLERKVQVSPNIAYEDVRTIK